jgi:hypothetical protein
MAKKRGRPVSSDRDDVVIRVDRQVVKRLRYLADSRGVTVAEMASDFLRPIVDREFDKLMSEERGR